MRRRPRQAPERVPAAERLLTPPERTAEDVAEAAGALATLYDRLGWTRARPPLAEAARPEALAEYAAHRRAAVADALAQEPEPVSAVCDPGDHSACPACGCGCHA